MKNKIVLINALYDKMHPLFRNSWDDKKEIEPFGYRTYTDGRYGIVEFYLDGRKELAITFNRDNEILVNCDIAYYPSINKVYELMSTLFTHVSSFETMSSEKQKLINDIRTAKRSVRTAKKEVAKLETNLLQFEKEAK